MKRTSRFFVWIVLFAVGLMVTILITQVNTLGLLSRLKNGNNQAALTFSINNRLQEMVNEAFELENKFIRHSLKKINPPYNQLKDSLTRLGYNITILSQTITNSQDSNTLVSLVSIIDNQVGLSFRLLNAIEAGNDTVQRKLVDSLKEGHFGDSIYARAISFQQSLEENLSETLIQNNKLTEGLSSLNRILAIVSMAAIMLLATIIIRRQRKQLKLIKELEEAKTQALHSANIKNQFLANMSHEIRTPLNALQGFSKLLSETTLDKNQKKYTQIIASSSDNLLNLVNDILDFSKIEAGAFVIRNKPFQLLVILHELQSMFEAQAVAKGLQLEFENDSELPETLAGDAGRIRQVLLNLLSNAIKFTEKGKVKVMTKLLREDEKNAVIKFIVADSGVGIPADKTESIFERFEQLDNSLTRHYGGTGLGLAISKRLIELMGGTITLKSQLNAGSEFIVEVKLSKWNELTEKTPVEDTIMQENNNNSYADISDALVLVVEDNPMNQQLIEILLERNGYKFILVKNGIEALEVIEREKPDLILMDIQMPEMDGLEATRHLRNKMGPGVPVIAMTAHVLPGEKERCLDAGMSDYMSKPVDEAVLIQKLTYYLGPKPSIIRAQISKYTSVKNEELKLDYLYQICNNDLERINVILKHLQDQLKTDVIVLEAELISNNLAGIKRICHYLKSTLSPIDEENEAPESLRKFNEYIIRENTFEEILNEGQKLISVIRKTINKLNERSGDK